MLEWMGLLAQLRETFNKLIKAFRVVHICSCQCAPILLLGIGQHDEEVWHQCAPMNI